MFTTSSFLFDNLENIDNLCISKNTIFSDTISDNIFVIPYLFLLNCRLCKRCLSSCSNLSDYNMIERIDNYQQNIQ